MNQNVNNQDYWKKCSSCRKEIHFSSDYYICNISTCQAKRTGKQFCSVSCWDAHLGYINHRTKTYAIKRRSPATNQLVNDLTNRTSMEQQSPDKSPAKIPEDIPAEQPKKRIIIDSKKSNSLQSTDHSDSFSKQANSMETDTLVVVSKVKKLIADEAGFNTSKCCIDRLTKKVIEECLKGIKKAAEADRKTVMGRDID